MRLFRVDHPRGIEGRGVEELVRVEFFEGGRVQDAGLDVSRNGDNRGSLLARIHQPIEQMDDTGTGGSTYRDWTTAQVSLGNSRKNPVFFVADMDEFDFAV